MSIIQKRYNQLAPCLDLLKDEAVMAQAWKKTDAYLRYRNSYSDILELETTALCLNEKLMVWTSQIASETTFTTEPVLYVPCPKNYEWKFTNSKMDAWRPVAVDDGKGQELRPLAHLTVRDQVLATTVMLCLADAIESLQGNPDPSSYASPHQARKTVVSYGNRLYCDWTSDNLSHHQKGRFRWGNTSFYSQYFVDYQRFLARPVEVCRQLVLPNDDNLFILKLDLAKFYDSIDQGLLVPKLKNAYARYVNLFSIKDVNVKEDQFWNASEHILSWRWEHSYRKLDLGIPQGLVSGGFFANAFMLEFDDYLKQQIFRDVPFMPFTMDSFKVHDYCRYVDDIRLVVELKNFSPIEIHDLKTTVADWFEKQLKAVFGDVDRRPKIQEKKTEIHRFKDYTVNGSTSALMKNLQSNISQAADAEVLEQATSSLDHLLALADLPKTSSLDKNPLKLHKINRPKGDVRDDTVKRFLANRYRKVLRERRMVADAAIPVFDDESGVSLTEVQLLDNEIETVARKLVSVWSHNPSLISVLKCALDLFPSQQLLTPVLEALETKLRSKSQKEDKQREKQTAFYIIGEIFKAAAIETGTGATSYYPAHSDVQAYRLELKKFALKLLNEVSVLPWFVQQQIALFAAVINMPVKLPRHPKMENYQKLLAAFDYKSRLSNSDTAKNSLLHVIIATRQTQQWPRFHLWFGNELNLMKMQGEVDSLIQTFIAAQPDQVSGLIQIWSEEPSITTERWLSILRPYHWCINDDFKTTPIEKWSNRELPLLDVVLHADNPFTHENALTKLAQELLKQKELEEIDSLELGDFNITVHDWKRIQEPQAENLTIRFCSKWRNDKDKPMNSTPIWVQPEKRWAYRLGRLLRSAVVGEMDFTSRSFAVKEHQVGRYSGLNTSWVKRKMGLMPVTAGLGKESVPISPWLTHTIMVLLQWPGLHMESDDGDSF